MLRREAEGVEGKEEQEVDGELSSFVELVSFLLPSLASHHHHQNLNSSTSSSPSDLI